MVEKLNRIKVFRMKAETGRWLFVIFGLIIQMCLGGVYSWGTFKAPVIQHFNLNATEGGLPFILFIVFFAILMPFSGRLILKYGPRKVGMIGGILVGLGWFLSGYATNLVMLCFTYGLLAGAGVGLAYGVPIQVSTRWFPDRKGLAVGMTVGGFGLSAVAISPIGNAIINAVDIIFMFKAFGIAFLILTVMLFLTLRFPAANWKPSGWAGVIAGAAAVRSFTASQMVRTRGFWALYLCFVFGSIAGLLAIGNASPIAQETIKISAGLAATLTGVFAIFNFAGRPIFGWLTDLINPSKSAALTFILIALGTAGILLFAREGATAVYIVSFAFLWMALGGWLAIAPTATATFFGPANSATNYGIMFSAYGLGAIVSNIVSGISPR